MPGELEIGWARAPLEERSAGLAQASDRYGQLAFAAALAFMANLYASPAFYWPVFEKARLGVVTSGVCAFAVFMRRITSGERLKLGGAPAAVLFAYAAAFPLSFAWTISPGRTQEAVVDIAKLLVLYVALLNALNTPSRLRAFLIVGAIATLAPSLGGIHRWMKGEDLVEGYRTAWRGNYADPNRLAMGLVLLIPAGLAYAGEARRPLLRALLLFSAVSSVAAVVLTHSRSGAVALALALGLLLARSRRRLRGLLLALVGAAALAALAPKSFWTRSESIADYEEDPSFSGRERAWRMLMVIFEERPFTGVGAGGFIDAWDRFAPLGAGGRHLIAHNIFMETLGELGIIALLLFGTYCAWLLARLWRAGRDPVAGLDARVLLAGVAGYIVCELVNGYARAFNLYAAFAAAAAAAAMATLRRDLTGDVGVPRGGTA